MANWAQLGYVFNFDVYNSYVTQDEAFVSRVQKEKLDQKLS